MIKKYRKKPVQIEAIQFEEFNNPLRDNIEEIKAWMKKSNSDRLIEETGTEGVVNIYHIRTLEGNMRIRNGDYIIKGIKGEFYPCGMNIFEQTYEEVE